MDCLSRSSLTSHLLLLWTIVFNSGVAERLLWADNRTFEEPFLAIKVIDSKLARVLVQNLTAARVELSGKIWPDELQFFQQFDLPLLDEENMLLCLALGDDDRLLRDGPVLGDGDEREHPVERITSLPELPQLLEEVVLDVELLAEEFRAVFVDRFLLNHKQPSLLISLDRERRQHSAAREDVGLVAEHFASLEDGEEHLVLAFEFRFPEDRRDLCLCLKHACSRLQRGDGCHEGFFALLVHDNAPRLYFTSKIRTLRLLCCQLSPKSDGRFSLVDRAPTIVIHLEIVPRLEYLNLPLEDDIDLVAVEEGAFLAEGPHLQRTHEAQVRQEVVKLDAGAVEHLEELKLLPQLLVELAATLRIQKLPVAQRSLDLVQVLLDLLDLL